MTFSDAPEEKEVSIKCRINPKLRPVTEDALSLFICCAVKGS